MQYFLAIDIGASSGRHILGWLQSGKLCLEEVHRFKNGVHAVDGSLCWDMASLSREVIYGLKKCKMLGKIPSTVGIDTWGVDFVLLDSNDQVVGNTVSYRDNRTQGMDEALQTRIDDHTLYQLTGIQKQPFNSIYQLLAIDQKTPDVLMAAKHFLMIPDYLNFLLTGVKINEYTNAKTTQLVNCRTEHWDPDLVPIAGAKTMLKKIGFPGDQVGRLKPEVQAEVGYDAEVLLVASHDTASALMALPQDDPSNVYISSGTWSLIGTFSDGPILSEQSRQANFTNSGGYHKNLHLKNIMGLWMIQEISRELGGRYDYGQLCNMAAMSSIQSKVDCSDPFFLAPDSMIDAVRSYCERTGQEIPYTPAELSAVVYNSLARSYALAVEEIEAIRGIEVSSISIVGGGAQAAYLNQKTADLSRKSVIAGPVEGTAIGNILCQMIAKGAIENFNSSKEWIRKSFEIKQYSPNEVNT